MKDMNATLTLTRFAEIGRHRAIRQARRHARRLQAAGRTVRVTERGPFDFRVEIEYAVEATPTLDTRRVVLPAA
jgi:hypothetical protein